MKMLIGCAAVGKNGAMPDPVKKSVLAFDVIDTKRTFVSILSILLHRGVSYHSPTRRKVVVKIADMQSPVDGHWFSVVSYRLLSR